MSDKKEATGSNQKQPLTNEGILNLLNEIYLKVNQGVGSVIAPVEKFAVDYMAKEADP